MKFTRSTLRGLALGFLSSAVVTAGFALYFQGGNIQGTNGSSVLGGSTTTTTTEQQSQVAALESEKAALESTQNNLNASIASMKDAASKQSSELESLKKNVASNENSTSTSGSSDVANGSSDESQSNTAAESTATEGETTTAQAEQNNGANATTPDTSAAVHGTFTISPGDTAEEVAANLAAAGYIASAQDFMDVVDRWDLSTVLQAGSYQLDSNMNVNTIAEILTEGVYYWIP